jgi:RNA polymerase sigma-70 factor (ECF subfamily)
MLTYNVTSRASLFLRNSKNKRDLIGFVRFIVVATAKHRLIAVHYEQEERRHMPQDANKKLVRELRRGSTAALEEVIANYAGYVTAVALRVLSTRGTQEDAEEVAADVFATLWRKARGLRGGSDLKAWLAVVARNTAITKLHALAAEQRRVQAAAAEAALDVQAHETTPSSPAAMPPLQGRGIAPLGDNSPANHDSQLAAAMAALKPGERELVHRHYVEQQKLTQIAAESGLSVAGVKNRLYRARNKLRSMMTKSGLPVPGNEV